MSAAMALVAIVVVVVGEGGRVVVAVLEVLVVPCLALSSP